MNNNGNSFEPYTEYDYVPRKGKGRRKRRSRPNIKVNADQTSDNSDVVETDLEDQLSSELYVSNDKYGESSGLANESERHLYDTISTDSQLQTKPVYETEELINEKVEQSDEGEIELLTDEPISESKNEKIQELHILNNEIELHTAEPISESENEKVQELINVRALSKHTETYELEKFEKKVLLIFNQENVEGYLPRHGTNIDATSLKNTFEGFGFEVTEYKDLTKKEIFDRLKAFSTQDFTDYGCIGIAVLTHGSNGGLLRAKDDKYSEIEIINLFKVHDKPTLVTKPKILIVQACRGFNLIPGAPVLRAGKIRTDVDSSEEPYILPVEADMLILHSSYVGTPSHRNELTGSWFVQSLCKKINQLAATHDLQSIITAVNRDVAIDQEHAMYNRRTLEMQVNKQMPVMTSTLIRKLYLKKFGDPPIPLVTMSDSTPTTSQHGSTEVLNCGSTNSPMLVTFGPCSCFLEHFEYIKNCLRFFVEENPEDRTALSFFEIAQELEDGVTFNAIKQKLTKAICKHLMNNAKNCHYYKYLYFYKHD